MENVAANRMELLATKKRRKLASKGYDLLKKKRDALIKHFFDYVKEYKERSADVIEQLSGAYDVLHVAQAVSGVNRVKSLAYSTKESFKASTETKNLMGVKITSLQVTKQPVEHNASLIGTSNYVSQAQTQFQDVVPELVKLAELEQTIFALADEIRKTKRRVNALEHIYLPKLEETEKSISDRLAEMEREEFTRLKHVKGQLEE